MKYDYITDVKTETLKTGRTYYTPDGAYPSITTILGKTADNTWLQRWIDRVGEEEAARVSKEATDRGTLVHDFAERYFNDEDITDLEHQTPDVRQMSQDLIVSVEELKVFKTKAITIFAVVQFGMAAAMWLMKIME